MQMQSALSLEPLEGGGDEETPGWLEVPLAQNYDENRQQRAPSLRQAMTHV